MPQSKGLGTTSQTDLLQDDQDGSSAVLGTQNGTVTVNGGWSSGAVTSSAPPVFSNDQIVRWLRTQWGGQFEGSTMRWFDSSVGYYIGGTPYASGSYEANSTATMTSLMQNRAALAFELWDDVIALDLNPTTSSASRQIQFEYADYTLGNNTYTRPVASFTGTGPYGTSQYAIASTEIWLSSSWPTHDSDADLSFDGYGFQTYLHEIGHSLGLSHPGTYNEGSGQTLSYLSNAEFAQDTRRYTVMSYFGGYKAGAGWQTDGDDLNWLFSSTPMLYDVLAIQAIYGADIYTRRTDTVYGFNSTADRDVFDFTKNPQPIFTIWDAGGIDTLDTSGFSAQQRIDLNAGTYSDIGGLTQNIAIAFGAVIENAIGGAGTDTIIGNATDNRLKGGAGDDTINSGAGIDSALFSKAFSQYTLTTLSTNSILVVGPDGTDTVTNVEKLVFSDRTVDSPNAKSVSISDARTTEGRSGTKFATFTVTRTGGSGSFSIDYATADSTATVADGDYVATSGTLSFGDGVNSQTISVIVNGDTKIETDETFWVRLSNPTDAAMIIDNQGVGEIGNDDLPVGSLSISDSWYSYEAGSAWFTITRTGGTVPFTVDYATADGTATVADGDYRATSGTLSFEEGVTSKTLTVRLNDDDKIEDDETFFVNLSNVTSGGTISDTQGDGRIENDDFPAGSVSISNATVREGNSGTQEMTFSVNRTGGVGRFSVHYATVDDSATAASGDYVAESGILTFGNYEKSQTISITIRGDTEGEQNESFNVVLSGGTNGVIIDEYPGRGNILNDDVLPSFLTIQDRIITEGDAGTKIATFFVNRSGGTQPITVDYATADGTATTADGDYVATSGTLHIGGNVFSGAISVVIKGDTTLEGDESFKLNLSNAYGVTIVDAQAIGTIVGDDSAVAISDTTITEGDGGVKVAAFVVTRTGGTTPFSVNYATGNGTATVADGDYVATSGTLSFAAGIMSQTIEVTISGDTKIEADETFKINLSKPSTGVTIGDAQAIGTIADDDLPGSVAISDVAIAEGDSGTRVMTFTVARNGGTAPFSVNYATANGTATVANGDYAATSGTLSFAAGVHSQTISVTVNGDTGIESNETFRVNLSGATNGATIGDAQAIGTIANDDTLPGTVAISDVTIVEGNDGTRVATFTMIRTGGTTPFSIDYATLDGTATVADGDYGAASGTVSFGPGIDSRTISVTINGDTRVEADETFQLKLSNATNGATIGDAQAVGTIVSDDSAVAISDATIAEGDGGTKVATFTVTRTGGTTPFSVNYATRNGNATVADGDYAAASGSLSFAAGIMSQTIAVTIAGDTRVEANETFSVNLSTPTDGVTIADGQAIGTIVNDDFLPGSVAISDVTIAEGNGGTSVATFTVSRTGGAAAFSVNYAIANGTAAVTDGDYLAAAGTLSFAAGANSQTIAVTINGDTKFEADETFRVNLSGATNGATIADPQAIGTITNDDIQAGRVVISDVTIAEGVSGSKMATFTVARTGGTAPFSINYATADGTATVADGDYVATSGMLSFGAGAESRTVSVKINGDLKFEADETFRVNLSDATNGAKIGDALGLGTIANDDTLPGTVTISDITIAEGNSGTKLATFTVTRTGGAAPFNINYATADGTAKSADGDYLAASGILSFGTGTASKTISVKIAGDTRFEADETFRVNLSGATNGAKIGDAQAIGTLSNDDTLPGTVAISDVTIAEGNSGAKVATFTVTRTGGTGAFNVDYASADLLATVSDGDYLAAAGTLSFADGVTSRTISVKINGDTKFEADETFRIDLSGATNGAVIGDPQAIGTIGNDDVSATAKIVIGDGKANTLKGGSDSDLLYGLDGNDVLIGGPANGGVNQLNGGRGIDTASYAGTASGVSADLALQRGSVNGVLTDRMDSIENLTGGGGNDTLLGDDNANLLSGAAGADRLAGRGGADIFGYGAWTDSNLVAGYDTIDDFVSGTDKIDLTALHASASHIAFVSMGASTMIHVGRNPGVFDPATDLALTVTTNAIGINDLRL